MRTARALNYILQRIDKLFEQLAALSEQFGEGVLIGRTRMQRALPIKVKDRITSWQEGILDAQLKIVHCELSIQLVGPKGNLEAFGKNAKALKIALAKHLNTVAKKNNWQNVRGTTVSLAEACSHLTGALGKMSIDISLMAQNELSEITLSGGGGSSALPHKQNPIRAEASVTLAHFNATLISGMHHSLVHEQEHSGAAWTLEWMLLPQMIVAAGGATRNAIELLNSITAIGAKS